jgi:hypothetical protein
MTQNARFGGQCYGQTGFAHNIGTSAGKIFELWDRAESESLVYILGSLTESGFVRLRPEPFGSCTT